MIVDRSRVDLNSQRLLIFLGMPSEVRPNGCQATCTQGPAFLASLQSMRQRKLSSLLRSSEGWVKRPSFVVKKLCQPFPSATL